MVYNTIAKEKMKGNGFSKTKIFRIFAVSSTGYYNWVERYEDRKGKRAQKTSKLRHIQECFRKIIKKLGFVPGKRTFRLHMWRDYEMHLSVKYVRSIMMGMNLLATRPKKDAYKGQATHFHECAAKQNHVKQQFRIAPRMIILTDITYLYYGNNRTLCYLCVFKDAYTAEVLGYSIRRDMSVELVKEAYTMMMSQYGTELKKANVYIHSDQGSQYLSTQFQTLLNDEGFIQSMSARGNSQDNAPMESFFGRMKTEIIDIIARCPNIEVVKELVKGYMVSYNTQRYQYGLAGLTPKEYYEYVTTGIYPLDNYFGVQKSDLMSIEQLVDAKLEKQRKQTEHIKAKREAKEKELSLSAGSILARDQKKIRKEINKWESTEATAILQLKKLRELLEKTKEAARFYSTVSQDILEKLKKPQNWKNYKEFDYVNDLGALY